YRAKRTRSAILVSTSCLRRYAAISTTSPNQDGSEGTDSAEVWIHTDPSAILVICASLRERSCFFLLKKAHGSLYSLQLSISWALPTAARDGVSPPLTTVLATPEPGRGDQRQ